VGVKDAAFEQSDSIHRDFEGCGDLRCRVADSEEVLYTPDCLVGYALTPHIDCSGSL